MDYVKVDDKVAKALGRPRRSIINAIKAGSIKGKQFSPRDTRIEASELPSSFFADNPLVETHVEADVRTEASPETKTTKTATTSVSPALQDELDGVKLAEAKVKRIEAETKLAEAEGKRDLPDKIARRDEESIKREELSRQRENAISQRELLCNQREQNIKTSENNLINQVNGAESYIKAKTAEANKIVTDANNYDIAKRTEADAYYTVKTTEADALDADIQAKHAQLDDLNTQVAEKIESLIKEIRKWTSIADTHATRSYHIAQKASGQTEAFHTRKSNDLWDLKEMLSKILKTIGG